MTTSPSGIKLIKSFEGLRLKPYLCPAGVPTQGYGHTNGVKLNDPEITEAQADDWLAEDLKQFEDAVSKAVKVKLNDNQFSALVSFTYNVGPAAFRSSTLLRYLNAGNYAAAANEFLKWNMASGKVIYGLSRRRQAEKAMFERGPGGTNEF